MPNKVLLKKLFEKGVAFGNGPHGKKTILYNYSSCKKIGFFYKNAVESEFKYSLRFYGVFTKHNSLKAVYETVLFVMDA